MNKSAELITEEFDSLVPSVPVSTAGEVGAEAATRYLQSHARSRSREEGGKSILPEIAGNAMAAAFMFGIFLGRCIRK